jgi:hypothetical protein
LAKNYHFRLFSFELHTPNREKNLPPLSIAA